MGCASSSPLVTGAHNVADAAKNGVSDAVQAGEGVMHGKFFISMMEIE